MRPLPPFLQLTIAQFCLLLLFIPARSAFLIAPHSSRRAVVPLRSFDNDTSESSNDNDERINSLRNLLEASWNADTMGTVPTSPASAAQATAESLQAALSQKKLRRRIFLVDLHLPQYDKTSREGSRWYDEVLAVEFCVYLTERLGQRSAILVRDDATVETVQRVWNARRGETSVPPSSKNGDSNGGSAQTKTSEASSADDDQEDLLFYDDFADFGTVEDTTSSTPPVNDTDSFRQKLDSILSSSSSEKEDTQTDPTDQNLEQVPPTGTRDSYRLLSLFGNDEISSGADMSSKVIRSLSKHVQIYESDDIIIILSAASRQETAAVRALVQRYGTSKTVVLVNCRFDSMPRELLGAQTVYSLQPLMIRPSADPSQTTAKVVILRRYPRDWELYADDCQQGFELVTNIPANQVDRTRGPSLEWVAERVRQYLDSRRGRVE